MFVPPKRILVPTDFSRFSDNALQYGLDIAAQYGAKVFVIHVLPPKVYSDHTITIEMVDALKKQRLEAAAQSLHGEVEKFSGSRNVEVEPIVRSGVAHEEIGRAERDLKADLIVIASHGQTGLMSILVGSVAGKVAQAAACPVLLVRSPGVASSS
ncbi:MAG TPA: universal stress protein [Syntrophorhabdaceae bacterium]|jgi:nucleotide-binding universal stress UspA family protein